MVKMERAAGELQTQTISDVFIGGIHPTPQPHAHTIFAIFTAQLQAQTIFTISPFSQFSLGVTHPTTATSSNHLHHFHGVYTPHPRLLAQTISVFSPFLLGLYPTPQPQTQTIFTIFTGGTHPTPFTPACSPNHVHQDYTPTTATNSIRLHHFHLDIHPTPQPQAQTISTIFKISQFSQGDTPTIATTSTPFGPFTLGYTPHTPATSPNHFQHFHWGTAHPIEATSPNHFHYFHW